MNISYDVRAASATARNTPCPGFLNDLDPRHSIPIPSHSLRAIFESHWLHQPMAPRSIGVRLHQPMAPCSIFLTKTPSSRGDLATRSFAREGPQHATTLNGPGPQRSLRDPSHRSHHHSYHRDHHHYQLPNPWLMQPQNLQGPIRG